MNSRVFDWNEPDMLEGSGLVLTGLEGFKNKFSCFVGGSGRIKSDSDEVISLVNGNHRCCEILRKSGGVTPQSNKAYDWNTEGEPLAYTDEEKKNLRASSRGSGLPRLHTSVINAGELEGGC